MLCRQSSYALQCQPHMEAAPSPSRSFLSPLGSLATGEAGGQWECISRHYPGPLPPLLAYAPDELVADGAEGRLWEEGGCEFMTLDMVHTCLLDGPAAVVQREEALTLQVTGLLGVCGEDVDRDIGVLWQGCGGWLWESLAEQSCPCPCDLPLFFFFFAESHCKFWQCW